MVISRTWAVDDVTIMLNLRSRPAPPALADDPVVLQLRDRLTSLHDHCLTNLANGLDAISHGDLTVAVSPVSRTRVCTPC